MGGRGFNSQQQKQSLSLSLSLSLTHTHSGSGEGEGRREERMGGKMCEDVLRQNQKLIRDYQ
jgi:hypothetical protein